ncbi:DUF423 domain-containing protein [Candidatus Poribacteria bacterium]|nr:DUF423 domain-containing protein [Candidatus Poribacteria bacterium]
MSRIFFALGSGFALIAVITGAFAAHTLKSKLSPDMFQVFEVAVRYQMYHALGLIAVAWAASQWSSQLIATSGWLFVAGIVIFSGSLYILSLTGVRWLGAITPIGGVAFIIGWGCLLWAAIRG